MRTLMAVWLARWQASVILRLMAVVEWLCKPVAMAGPEGSSKARHRAVGHHAAEEHALPGIWMVSPRAAIGIWLAGAVVAFAHDVHLFGRSDLAVEIHKLDRIGIH